MLTDSQFLWLFSLTLIFNLFPWCLLPPQVWELQLQSSFIPVVSAINHRSEGLLYPATRASSEGGAQFPWSNVSASRSLVPVQYGGVYFFVSFFYVHHFIQMMQIGSAVWTGLTLITMLLLAQWDVGCWGLTLNSVPLRPASPKPIRASVGASLQRHKRNWVWNQFFVLEEYTGDDPLYVGKVKQNISSGSDIIA